MSGRPGDHALLVLHDIGDEAGGEPWRAAFEEAGWRGPVLAPDLPGHAGAAPPVGGGYEIADAAFVGARLLATDPFDGSLPVLVGVGANGWAAHLLAAGGQAAGLALVDGLGGPWLDPVACIAEGVQWVRAIADDPEALAPPQPGVTLDPRLRHGVPGTSNRQAVVWAAAVTEVPTALLTSPTSNLTADDVADLASTFAGAVSRFDVVDRSPAVVGPLVTSWADAFGGSDLA